MSFRIGLISCASALVLLNVCPLQAQVKNAPAHRPGNQSAATTIPFAGCKSDGQLGPRPAPKGRPHPVKLSAAVGGQLAFYSSGDVGAIAPRGWHGSGCYGSDGETLLLVPNSSKDSDTNITGPAVQLNVHTGGTSGRFAVARIISRFFPAYKKFLNEVLEEGTLPKDEIISKPCRTDRVTRINNNVVEFKTPAGSEGFGTEGSFKKGSTPVYGVALLTGGVNDSECPDAIVLRVRLGPDKEDLAAQIIQQFERDEHIRR